jgi:hypothetical protein
MNMWIPYTRVPDSDTLTYTSIYNNTNAISNDLWDPIYTSYGHKCIHCSAFSSCSDIPCTTNMNAHICSFPAGAPMAQLKGFCSTTGLGKNNHRKVSPHLGVWAAVFHLQYSLMFLAAMNLLGAMIICPRPLCPWTKFLGSWVPCIICPCTMCPDPDEFCYVDVGL